MDTYLNFHSHRVSLSDAETVIMSRRPCSDGELYAGGLFTVGVHPWSVSEEIDSLLTETGRLAGDANCVAIGEIGLDKCAKADWALQEDAFRRQLTLADSLNLPIVIHCVRAWAELFHILRSEGVEVPRVIHGFRGKPALARQLIDNGFYLSFGFRYHPDSLSLCPSDRLFLETDEDSRSIEILYREAAVLRAVSPESLQQVCWKNLQAIRVWTANRLV